MRIEYWPRHWAMRVIERDKGVCQLCGFDGSLMVRILQGLKWDHARHRYQDAEQMKAYDWLQNFIWRLGFTPGIELMQADHIIPIVEGGTNKLENGRTLCQPCHKAETAKLARRRKWDRRARRHGFLFSMKDEEPERKGTAHETPLLPFWHNGNR
jgi:5-methylcytosine-specific restriction endonuclease McrA